MHLKFKVRQTVYNYDLNPPFKALIMVLVPTHIIYVTS